MTDKQALRDIAEKTKIAGEAPVMPFEQRINALNEFMRHLTPATVLALLDDLEAAEHRAAVDHEAACSLVEENEELKRKLETAEKRIAEQEARILPPLNDDLVAILGRPNFTCAHLAELLRKSGEDIRRKSEFEQAAVIHWFLRLYLEHGDKWENVAKADIQSRAAAAGIGKEE